jgi:hypothetical protein
LQLRFSFVELANATFRLVVALLVAGWSRLQTQRCISLISMLAKTKPVIMLSSISFSTFDLLFGQHDQHDTGRSTSRVSRQRPRWRAGAGARSELCCYHVDHVVDHGDRDLQSRSLQPSSSGGMPVARNLFNRCTVATDKMSLSLFSYVRLVSVVSVLTFIASGWSSYTPSSLRHD